MIANWLGEPLSVIRKTGSHVHILRCKGKPQGRLGTRQLGPAQTFRVLAQHVQLAKPRRRHEVPTVQSRTLADGMMSYNVIAQRGGQTSLPSAAIDVRFGVGMGGQMIVSSVSQAA